MLMGICSKRPGPTVPTKLNLSSGKHLGTMWEMAWCGGIGGNQGVLLHKQKCLSAFPLVDPSQLKTRHVDY